MTAPTGVNNTWAVQLLPLRASVLTASNEALSQKGRKREGALCHSVVLPTLLTSARIWSTSTGVLKGFMSHPSMPASVHCWL